MLNAHPEIEAVIISSANHLHLKQMKLCAERGIHIFSMKIPTFDMKEYDKMQELEQKNNIVCQVELELRYNPVIKRVKELYDSGAIGKLVSFCGQNTTHFPGWWLPWVGDPEKSYGRKIVLREGDNRYRGGALSDHPHVFDMARYITGSEFEWVYADIGSELRSGMDVEEIIYVVGKMKNGITFSLDPSYSLNENPMKVIGPGWELYPKRVEVYFTLVGENGVIFADPYGPCVHHTGLPYQRYTTLIANKTSCSNTEMLNEFADCIRNKKIPTVTLESHRKTIEVMNACYESVYKSDVVYL